MDHALPIIFFKTGTTLLFTQSATRDEVFLTEAFAPFADNAAPIERSSGHNNTAASNATTSSCNDEIVATSKSASCCDLTVNRQRPDLAPQPRESLELESRPSSATPLTGE